MDGFRVFGGGSGSSQEEAVEKGAQLVGECFPSHRPVLAVMGITISVVLQLKLWLYCLSLNLAVLIFPSKEWGQDHPLQRVAAF